MPHRLEGGALVPRFENMGECNTGKQPNRKDHDVLFTLGERVLRACRRAFEQSPVAEEVPFARFLHFKPIVFDNHLDQQPPRLIWQGPLSTLETVR